MMQYFLISEEGKDRKTYEGRLFLTTVSQKGDLKNMFQVLTYFCMV